MIETEGKKAPEETQGQTPPPPAGEYAKAERTLGELPSMEEGRGDWPRVREGEEGELTLVPAACVGAGTGNAEAMVGSFRSGGTREMTMEELSLAWCKQLTTMARQMREKGFLSAADAIDMCLDEVRQHTSTK